MLSLEERDRRVKACYKVMSNTMQTDLYTFISYIKDGRDILEVAKQLIIDDNRGFVRTTKIVNSLYAWFENEYNKAKEFDSDMINIEQKAILNFTTVLNRIVSLELLIVQYQPFTFSVFGLDKEQQDKLNKELFKKREFFVLYANDEINDRKDINKRALILQPTNLFESVYKKVQYITEELPEVLRNATIDYTYKSAEEYEYYF